MRGFQSTPEQSGATTPRQLEFSKNRFLAKKSKSPVNNDFGTNWHIYSNFVPLSINTCLTAGVYLKLWLSWIHRSVEFPFGGSDLSGFYPTSGLSTLAVGFSSHFSPNARPLEIARGSVRLGNDRCIGCLPTIVEARSRRSASRASYRRVFCPHCLDHSFKPGEARNGRQKLLKNCGWSVRPLHRKVGQFVIRWRRADRESCLHETWPGPNVTIIVEETRRITKTIFHSDL